MWTYENRDLKLERTWKNKEIKTWNDNTPSLSCRGEITLSKIDKICQWVIINQISTIPMHMSKLVKIRWDLLRLLSWNSNTDVLRADNVVKNWRNLAISNPKADLHNINTDTKFGENQLVFTEFVVRKWKCRGQITQSKIDEISPLAIPKQFSTISMYTLSLVKIEI